ncbi:MAG: acyl-CoA dehydrogenase family protein [Acidimicrobiales bacterium]
MDLEFSDEQEMFRASVRDLFQKQFGRDYVRECDAQRRPPKEAFDALAGLGYLGLNIPAEHGGAGATAVDVAILLEELGRGFLDLAFWVFRNVSHGGHAISAHGSPEQKAELLPRFASGEISVCFALTEPESGSDAAALETRATEDGDRYRVNGQKVFCSGFRVSDYVLTATRTAEDKHGGITLLLIPTDVPGLTASPIETLGHWPLGTTLLGFEDVDIPRASAVGRPGDGWRVITDMLQYERLCLSAARAGAAQAALSDALEYVGERHQFGRPIGKFQAVSHKLADMQVMADIARMLVYRFAYRLDRGRATARDAATLKLYVSEAYKAIADMGLQVFGGYGYTMDFDIQRHFRESRLGVIGAGTSEIQRNIIAKTMGL